MPAELPSLHSGEQREPVPGVWLIRLGAVSLYAGLMIAEWWRWPNVSSLIGPFGVLRYGSLNTDNILFLVLYGIPLLLLLLAFPLRPGHFTLLLSLLGLLLWVFVGEVVQGIGC